MQSASGPLVAGYREPRESVKRVPCQFERKGVGSDENRGRTQADRTQWRPMPRSEQQIVTPLAAIVADIHEGHARTSREIERGDPRVFHVDCQIDERRAIGFLVRSRPRNPGTPILSEPLVARTIGLPLSRDASRLGIKLLEVQRSTECMAQTVSSLRSVSSSAPVTSMAPTVVGCGCFRASQSTSTAATAPDPEWRSAAGRRTDWLRSCTQAGQVLRLVRSRTKSNPLIFTLTVACASANDRRSFCVIITSTAREREHAGESL